MKKSVLIIALIATVFTSCKNKVEKVIPEEVTTTKEIVEEHVDAIAGETWLDNIKLDNGSKWTANAETTEGVLAMQELLKTESTSTIEEYHQLANKLNDVKNTVVKECTMKGASHDNLHIWLYPLIEKIGALTEANNVEDASKIKQKISENLKFYFDYFI